MHAAAEEYPMQLAVAGTDDIHVGRLRRDESVQNGLSFWVVADNVRKGAALNAVQIAERLVLLPDA
jgi:aspartate-semialdehyde dehydrogenase